MRGKLEDLKGCRPIRGITPAGAGKTLQYALQYSAVQDHPRRCGENHSHEFAPHRGHGSPPQVRGKRRSCPTVVLWNGITPAGAGKTLPVVAVGVLIRDHPRRCGENR